MAGKTTLFALLAIIAISKVHNSELNLPILGLSSPSSSGLHSRYGLGSGYSRSSTGTGSSSTSSALPSAHNASRVDKVINDLKTTKILEKCKATPHDFVLVVDESGSITHDHWVREIMDFVSIVAKALEAGNQRNRLSIVQFSHTPKMVMDLTNFESSKVSDIKNAIQEMFSSGNRTFGTTYTGSALKFVRENILDKEKRFTLDMVGRSPVREKKNQVVILLTDGAANDYDVAERESLIARFNGVHFLVFGIGLFNNLECRKLVGCSQYGVCNEFIKANWENMFAQITHLFKRVCDTSVRNAVCLERWEAFGECSKKCGGGIQYAKFLGATTLSEATRGTDGIMGLTCEQQYDSVSNKFRSCNTQPCVDTVPTTIQEHVQKPVEDKSVQRESSTGESGALEALLGDINDNTDSDTSTNGSLETDEHDSPDSGSHSESNSSDDFFSFKHGSNNEDHIEPDHEVEVDSHYDQDVEHDEAEEEGADLAQPESASSDSIIEQGTEMGQGQEYEDQTSEETKYNYTRYIGGNRLRVVAVAATVVILTAISITAFSYLFLKGKGKTPLMPDPSDMEFMNAGDGDDVEPSENFQVSNADDGIWA
ncbi:hypothetical protein BEWA_005690 [Theileria equi strain WA]|uniref:VWFA domain-containing protein n=1 Tax=Theileria equi strain WA TaxID=1537102 RepID=L0B1N1_THEEQ|nr:hypothetical protein BEWA_005690 [Theileria equi strain WA]AFZ81161.1 hypothetical protein BEWA_005690 [Theileria equi strain WA]|eukprot:XP_004830827.1 hypothetical protein BEWA_005690 [Theileria equi strain WA]